MSTASTGAGRWQCIERWQAVIFDGRDDEMSTMMVARNGYSCGLFGHAADAWGWGARLGILVRHDDPVPEAELWAMAPLGVTLHVARFEVPRWYGCGADGAAGFAASPDLARGLRSLAQLEPDVICLCSTSVSAFAGRGFDAAFAAKASAMAGGTPVTTSATAILDALRATGVGRPALVGPPWPTEAGATAADRFLAAAGVEVAGTVWLDAGAGRHPPASTPAGAARPWRLRPHELYRRVRREFPPTADGVLVPSTCLRAVEAIAPLERDLGMPVITANQAVLWHCLQIAGTHPEVGGCGQLFDHRLPGLARRAAATARRDVGVPQLIR
jgi:maleate cis-trans isomerase